MLSIWKQLFLICTLSPHSKRKWRTVNGATQPTQCSYSIPKYECVTLAWPNWSLAKTTSSFRMFWTQIDVHQSWFYLKKLFPMLLFHKVCHWSKVYLLKDGFKLENGILTEVGSNESDVFVCLSTISLARLPMWLGIQQRTISLFAKSSWHFSKGFWICTFFELAWFIAFISESDLENIMNLLLVSQVLLKSKARSTALASAVKNDESLGIRCILIWLSDITAQPTFESSFDPSV